MAIMIGVSYLEIEAVFLDRDGTIGGNGYFIHPSEFMPYDNFYKAINILTNKRIKVFAFTNQHRISRGEVEIEDFRREFDNYGFTDSYICPHKMGADCDCQKPKPGMLIRAAEEHNLNLENCVVIGDLGTDMIAASKAGARKVLVKTGWGMGSLGEYRDQWKDIEAEYIAEDILDAIIWLMDKY